MQADGTKGSPPRRRMSSELSMAEYLSMTAASAEIQRARRASNGNGGLHPSSSAQNLAGG